MTRTTFLVSVPDALATLVTQVVPVAPWRIQVSAAKGLILAEPLLASAEAPASAIALRDGWAVVSHDLVGVSGYTPAVLIRHPRRVAIGEALPLDADAVLPLDMIVATGPVVEATDCVAPGEGARRRGEDAGQDAVLRDIGRAVRALDVAVAQAAGIETCSVRQPRLRLVGPEQDAAAMLLAGVYERCGAVVERVSSHAGRLAEELSRHGADLISVVGSADPILNAVDQAGSVIASRLALRPGEGAGCGLVGPTPVLWCPPRLEVALALAFALIEPCIARLAGALADPPAIEARLTRKISSAIGLTDVALLRRTPGGLEPVAVADLTLAAIALADAWLIIPPESEGFARGETVSAFAL